MQPDRPNLAARAASHAAHHIGPIALANMALIVTDHIARFPLLISIIPLLVGIAASGAFLWHNRHRHECDLCYRDLTRDGHDIATRKQRTLKLGHNLTEHVARRHAKHDSTDKRSRITLYATALLATALLALLIKFTPIIGVTIGCVITITSVAAMHLIRLHNQLFPWCPWCRHGGGEDDDDEPVTPPTPKRFATV